ncbi:hypothetical protein QCB44_08400 [Thiomicrorhabdus sp. zzn3]|uniref:hypothetical protein n=1 Tax=Thiomicrorhabdus sp. zzn3 TaxID=3039775 RepID=UPI002436985E|nr:hypothetical protein [Thiomicrorhabdus sp. zzn3]MDG6778722.1 hypothetical protein [Thiomicrorhabdus sp. zzn3]
MIRLLNLVFGWFGYEWIRDEQTNRPAEKESDASISSMDEDEGWDHLYQHTPSYRLRKKQTIRR